MQNIKNTAHDFFFNSCMQFPNYWFNLYNSDIWNSCSNLILQKKRQEQLQQQTFAFCSASILTREHKTDNEVVLFFEDDTFYSGTYRVCVEHAYTGNKTIVTIGHFFILETIYFSYIFIFVHSALLWSECKREWYASLRAISLKDICSVLSSSYVAEDLQIPIYIPTKLQYKGSIHFQ